MDDDEDFYETERSLKDFAIFDRENLDELVPPGYTSAVIFVDATPTSPLCWEMEKKAAEHLIQNGLKVSFELKLGIQLLSQATLQTASLAINEFRDRLLEPISEHVEAVVLKRYNEPFKTFEDRDREIDFLDILRTNLSPEIPVLLLFSCKSLQDPYMAARMFAQDRFSLFVLGLESSPIYTPSLCYNEGKALLGYFGRDIAKHQPKECDHAIIMPRFTSDASLLQNLVTNSPDAKVISEDSLAVEWEGLDELSFVKNTLAPTTLRLIAGFEAAGGNVVTIDQNPAKIV